MDKAKHPIIIDAELADAFMIIFNNTSTEMLKSVPPEKALRIGDFMYHNGYRMVFNRWHLQEPPTSVERRD